MPLPAPPGDNCNTKSMEDVWNDIRLASLYDPSDVNDFSSNSTAAAATTTTTTHSVFRSFVLHEFLSGPLIRDRNRDRDSPSTTLSHAPTTLARHPSSLQPPTSVRQHEHEYEHEPSPLNLTSASKYHTHTPHSSSSFHALDSSPLCPSPTNKRTRQHLHHSSDRHHQRMIKNRESAARSRARKQAYTNELEHELVTLREENARLRQQQEKFPLRPLDQHPKKRTLLRTSTAPF